MDTPRKPFSISGQEMKRIMALPKISLKIGGEIKSGHFDKETNRFFQTDENGKLTGKVAVVSKLPPAFAQSGAEDPAMHTVEEDNQEDDESKKKNKFLMPVIIVVGALIAAACIAVTVILPRLGGPNNDTPVDPNLPTGGQPGVVEITDYKVVKITRDIVPGQMFTLDDLKETTVPAETYDQAKEFGHELYSWESVDGLLGYYASEFISADSLLAQDDISAVPPYELNPWGVTDSSSTLIVVPVSEDVRNDLALNYGNYVDLTVKKVVANQVSVGPGSDPTGSSTTSVDGITLTTTTQDTTRTEQYAINDMTVCDILNANGESLYNTYCAYIGIPASKRLDYIAEAFWNDSTLLDRLTPAYILVRVSNVQAQALGDLTASNTSVAMRLKGSLNVVNNSQYMFAQEAADVKRVAATAIALNEQRAAEEEAARQQALEEAMAANKGD